MAEFHPYRQVAQTDAPSNDDRLLVYLAGGFSSVLDGADDAVVEAAKKKAADERIV